MGIKVRLLRELDGLLSEGQGSEVLGRWLFKNKGQVREALHMSDDLVAIQEIDLSNPATWPEDMRRQAFPKVSTSTT